MNINAHGLKLVEFGATEADTKALRWEVRSNGKTYAFDPEQNKDPEVAYFNGMVLRVKRALQYLKTLKGWNGKDLYASGGVKAVFRRFGRRAAVRVSPVRIHQSHGAATCT